MFKRLQGFLIGIMVCALLLGITPIKAAIDEYICYKADYKVAVHGVEYVNQDLPILNYKGNTYAPFRSILEFAGFNVNWNAELKQADVEYNVAPYAGANSEIVTTTEGTKKVDNTDLPFVNDENIMGKWDPVDIVKNTDDFIPGQRSSAYELWLGQMVITANGEMQVFINNGKQYPARFMWTNGFIINKTEEMCSTYTIKVIGSETYMFFEWKNGDYQYRNAVPWYYVMKQSTETVISGILEAKDLTQTVQPVKEENVVSEVPLNKYGLPDFSKYSGTKPIIEDDGTNRFFTYEGVKYIFTRTLPNRPTILQSPCFFKIKSDNGVVVQLAKGTKDGTEPSILINEIPYALYNGTDDFCVKYDYYVNTMLPLIQ